MPNRSRLPQRRSSETFTLAWGGLQADHVFTIGRYKDGRIGEIFINGGKSGEQVQAIARDCAILVSLALQHGVSLESLAEPITRDASGNAQTVIGAVLDALVKIEKRS